MSASAQIIGAEQLREVRLYGHLGKRFGRVHKLAVKSCREASQALAAIIDGFGQYLIDNSLPGYHVFVGRVHKSTNLGPDLLDMPLQPGDAVCIVPAVAGAKKAGVFQTIAGIVLIVVGIYFGQTYLTQAGVALLLGGVVALLTPTKKTDENNKPDNLPSYYYDGPINSTRQGGPVPLVYGRMIIGSAVISQGISATDLVSDLGTMGK